MKRLAVLFAIALLACTPTTPDGRGQSPSGTAAQAQRSPLSRITKLVVDKVESPTFEGRAFGEVGQYEKLTGRAFGVADPKDPVDATIVNIERAPRNAQGLVEYDVDFYILKPIDMTKGNKSLFYDVVNRGNKNLHTTFNVGAGGGNNPTKAADAGDGLLMNMGYTLVWSGWQGDVLPGGDRQTVRFPIATASSGGPITKKIWTEFVFDTPSTYTVPVSWDRGPDVKPYPAVESAMSQAALSRRKGTDGESQPIARSDWSFGKCADGKAVTPTNVDVCYPAGFSGDWVYDLVYEARDPMVMGLGFAATRDIMSFLRFDTSDGNPLVTKSSNKNPIEWALGFGSSQSGRFLKDLIYQGFNQDTNGRKVFDGAIPHISGSRKTYTNYEFAMPGRFSTQLEGHHYPGDQFPFTYATLTDSVSGKTDGVLAKCAAQKACPKIMHWDSGLEFWSARSSLVVTDTKGGAGEGHLPAAHEPAAIPRDAARAHGGSLPVGDEGDRAAPKPLPEPREGRARAVAPAERSGLPGDPGRDLQRTRQPPLGHRLQPASGAPCARPGLPRARAEGRRRRQRHGGRAIRQPPGSDRHLHRLEPPREGLHGGRGLLSQRQLRAVRADEGPAQRRERPAALSRGAVRHASEVRRHDQHGREAARGGPADAPAGCGADHRRGGHYGPRDRGEVTAT